MTAAAKTATFTDANGWKAFVELPDGIKGKLGADILKMCKTLDDVQRCAGMGDFRITGYDLPAA